MAQRATIAEMNSYHRFKKQPKSDATTRASASAGPHQRAQIRNDAAPATSQGKPYNRNAAPPVQKPKRRIVIMKSARKGPAK